MSALLPSEAKDDLIAGSFVCRYKAGTWNSVSADQFGEQMTLKIGKVESKGITLSPAQVAEWIESFPISAYLSDVLDHCFTSDISCAPGETPHKEEGMKRQKLDQDDRQCISTDLNRCSHQLKITCNVLCDISDGKVAPKDVNVADSLMLGAQMATIFHNSLPSGFHAKLSSCLKTMEHLKRGVKAGER